MSGLRRREYSRWIPTPRRKIVSIISAEDFGPSYQLEYSENKESDKFLLMYTQHFKLTHAQIYVAMGWEIKQSADTEKQI
jgi:hypothetical protein